MKITQAANKLAILIAVGVTGAGFYLLNKQASGPTPAPRAAAAPAPVGADRAETPHKRPGAERPPSGPFRAVRVIDGDSVVLQNKQMVRLVGIDAPEMNHPDPRIRQFARESRDFLKDAIEGRECRLDFDTGSDLRDAYERLLAYVFCGARDVNAEMVSNGCAYVYGSIPFSRREEFLGLEKEARRQGRGVWQLALHNVRLAELVRKYDALSEQGRIEMEAALDELLRKHPAPPETTTGTPATKEIEWRDAARHIGEQVGVTGTIVSTYNSGGACYLNFHEDYRAHLTAVIFASAFARFPISPEQHYRGRKVRMTGTLRQYKERPEIVLEQPTQIEVLDRADHAEEAGP